MPKLAILLCAAVLSSPVWAEIESGSFTDPTPRYDHGILGDAIEYGTLILRLSDGSERKFTLPPSRVFEDLAPRLADIDGDGTAEVIVIETSLSKGASLAIYDETGKLAATPFLGRPHRWLAPIGAADLDGDGRIEIAYVEKPHLTKELKIWRLESGVLQFVSSLPGLTNHQIDWDFIVGGIRDCGTGPEIITADSEWESVMVTRLLLGTLRSSIIGSYDGRNSLREALACQF